MPYRTRNRCVGALVRPRFLRVMIVGAVVTSACERDAVDREALLEPATCAGCHPDQYREWSASTHAYASDDPVFLAIDARGQRETDGQLGAFCLQCHAPMAVREQGITTAAELAGVPRSQRGVTCYFCHQAEAVLGDHNAPIVLAEDGVMRGGFGRAGANPAHGSIRSPLLDGGDPASSTLCGSCHDVVTPSGLRVERSYAEWQASVFSASAPIGLSCAACHMIAGRAPAAVGEASRRVHDHTFPGLDVPLTAWPGREQLVAAIDRDLAPSITSRICVTPTRVEVTLDNVSAGHAWPSGVTHARRAWVEVVARLDGGVVYQSGVVAPGDDPAELDDPALWLMRSRFLDPEGREVPMAWQAASIATDDLPAAATTDRQDPRFNHSVTRAFLVPPTDEVEVHVRVTPLGTALLRELEQSGDLAPGFAPAVPIFDVGPAARTWRLAEGYGCVPGP